MIFQFFDTNLIISTYNHIIHIQQQNSAPPGSSLDKEITIILELVKIGTKYSTAKFDKPRSRYLFETIQRFL